MNTANILLCFLPLLLKSSLTYADDCNQPEAYMDKLTVVKSTTSSITLQLRLGYCFDYELMNLTAYYKPKPHTKTPKWMKWIPTTRRCKTTIFHDSYGTNRMTYPLNCDISPPGEQTFTIDDLPFPDTNYEIKVVSYRSDTTTKVHMVNASTLPEKQLEPPKTGPGCFQVETTGTGNHRTLPPDHREVWIYWQQEYHLRTMYRLTVYQDCGDGKFKDEYTYFDQLKNGFMHLFLNFNRHRFVFVSQNRNGLSSESSALVIPAQEDILPPLWTTYYEDNERGTVLLSWKAPRNVTVTNYTVAWYDTRVGKVVTFYKPADGLSDEGEQEYMYINDFVIFDNNTNMVEVQRPEDVYDKMLLAVGVNTEKGSSGLTPDRSRMRIVWSRERFFKVSKY